MAEIITTSKHVINVDHVELLKLHEALDLYTDEQPNDAVAWELWRLLDNTVNKR